MPSAEKIIDKMKRQPNAITMGEIDKVLTHSGYRHDRQNGSHHQYLNDRGDRVTIPERRPSVLPVYVRDVLRRIENN